jgi:membrane protease YdiL (CAAX protease family)
MQEPISRRSALWALLLISPAASAGGYLAFTAHRGPLGVAAWVAAKFWLFGLPLVWMRFVDRERPSLSKPTRGGFGVALALGIAMAAAIVGSFYAWGRGAIEPAELRKTLEPLHLTEPAVYLGAAAYWVFVNSVLEEYVFRWFIFTRAERLMPGWAAVILSGLIFVAHHTLAMAAYLPAGLNALASLGIFIAAVIWSALYHRYRSVWVPWAAHACADVAIFVLGWRVIFG